MGREEPKMPIVRPQAAQTAGTRSVGAQHPPAFQRQQPSFSKSKPTWKRQTNWQDKYRRRVQSMQRKTVSMAQRRVMSSVKQRSTFAPTAAQSATQSAAAASASSSAGQAQPMNQSVDRILRLVAINEYFLYNYSRLVESIEDSEYQRYFELSKAGSGRLKAYFHKKAGMRAEALGEHERAKRHFIVAEGLLRIHEIRKSAAESRS